MQEYSPPQLRHPLDGFTTRQIEQMLPWAAALTILFGVAMLRIGQPLETDAAPAGMLALPFAGTPVNASAVVESWSAANLLARAGFVVGIDFILLVLYVFTLSLACIWAARQRPAIRTLGLVLAWMQLAAGALDVAENVALFNMLAGPITDFWPRLALICTWPKLAIIAAGGLVGAAAYALREWDAAFPTLFGRST